METREVLFNVEIYLSMRMTETHQDLYLYYNLFSDIGGLAGFLTFIISMVANPMNRYFLMNKMKRNIYYIKTPAFKSRHDSSE